MTFFNGQKETRDPVARIWKRPWRRETPPPSRAVSCRRSAACGFRPELRSSPAANGSFLGAHRVPPNWREDGIFGFFCFPDAGGKKGGERLVVLEDTPVLFWWASAVRCFRCFFSQNGDDLLKKEEKSKDFTTSSC